MLRAIEDINVNGLVSTVENLVFITSNLYDIENVLFFYNVYPHHDSNLVSNVNLLLSISYDALTLSPTEFAEEYYVASNLAAALTEPVSKVLHIEIYDIDNEYTAGYYAIESILTELFTDAIYQVEIDEQYYIDGLHQIYQDYSFDGVVSKEVAAAIHADPIHPLSQIISVLNNYAELYDTSLEVVVDVESVPLNIQELFELYTLYTYDFAYALDCAYTSTIEDTLYSLSYASGEIYNISEELRYSRYKINNIPDFSKIYIERNEDGSSTYFDLYDALDKVYNALTLSFADFDTEYQMLYNASQVFAILVSKAQGIEYYDEFGLTDYTLSIQELAFDYLNELVYTGSVDHIYYAEQFSIILGFDITPFINDYVDYGTPYLLTFITEANLDFMESNIIDAYGLDFYTAYRAAMINYAVAIDELPVTGFVNFETDIRALLSEMVDLAVMQPDFMPSDLVNILNVFLNNEIQDFAIELLNEYHYQVVENITNALCDALSVSSEDVMYNEIYTLIDVSVDAILADTFVVESFISDLIVILQSSEQVEVSTFAYSIGAMMLIISGEEIDYNEIFDFVQLPPEIESIDFNQLIETITSETTYQAYTISDVVVELVTDTAGNIIGEIMTVTLDIDFDIMISELSGSVTLTFEIVY